MRADVPMTNRTGKKVTRPREDYQQAVIMLLAMRRRTPDMGAGEFLLRHKTLADMVKERWDAVEDPEGLPSPDQVLSWL